MKTIVPVACVLMAVAAAAEPTSRLGDFIWKNDKPDRYHVPNIPIKGLRPGMRAEVRMWVDASGLSKGGVPEASLAWGSRRTGSSWACGSSTVKRWADPKIEKDAKGRRRFVCRTVVVPPDAVNPRIHFFAKRPAVGEIVYSDIELTLLPRTYDLVLGNSSYANAAADGTVRFVAGFVTDPEFEPLDRLVGTFVYTGTDGREVRKPAARLTDDGAEGELSVADMACGAQNIRFELSLRDGAKLAETNCPFTRFAKAVPRRVAFDARGRTIVEGRPFFPIGMYWSENTLSLSNSLERYAAAGVFNCLQTYEKAMTPEILDRYWARGLRVMASVKDIYLPDAEGTEIAFLPRGIATKAQETAYVAGVVNRCKDHPALLAWYTCDEMSRRYADRLEDRYALLKKLDPEHPVYVLAFPQDTRAFIRAFDVTGTDPYPVCLGGGKEQKPGLGRVWAAGEAAEEVRAAMFDLKPLWQVPQAFKWQWDHRENYDERFPTRRELSSMTWQQVAAGANGIFFYSYGQICNGTKNESELIEYFDETTVPVARELKDVQDVLLADPGPAVVRKPDRVRVRTWRKDGAVYALVCNTHPERRVGEIVLDGAWKTCESVFGSGVALKDGRLVLDMRPIATAMVKLTRNP